ncbi:MAG: serine/threonine protein kinase [Gemmatimonadetes bacterium]|nr:serine/threonine protein kinase [Gemmatimonadota bacterium]
MSVEDDPGDDPMDEQARRELGQRFVVQDLHRQGPGSLVYRAQDPKSGRVVAVKAIPRDGLRETGAENRFPRTATAATALDHPHIVPVYEWGTTAGFVWYAMDLVAARSLDEVLAESGPLDLKTCLRIVEQVASALNYGHRRGVTHGGVKPQNVMVDDEGWALLSDFGLPGALDRAPLAATPPDDPEVDRQLAYLAPEIQGGLQSVPASDQYALAVLVRESLVGPAPVGQPGSDADPPLPEPSLSRRLPRPEIPHRISQALHRALARSPAERFPTVLSFVAALDETRSAVTPWSMFAPSPHRKAEPRVLTMDPQPGGRRLRWWLISGVLAAVLGGALEVTRETVTWDPVPTFFSGEPQDTMVSSSAMPGDVGESAAPAPPPSPIRTQPVRPPVQARQPDPIPVPVRPSPPPAPRPAVAPEEGPPVEPGRLMISSNPWGALYIDGRPIGNTPQTNVALPPGPHRIRVVREGFQPFDRIIEVAPGELIRLTGLVLQEARR